MNPSIEALVTPGCPHAEDAIERVRSVAALTCPQERYHFNGSRCGPGYAADSPAT